MTRWSEDKLEDSRNEQIVFRKKDRLIFRLMIGENHGSGGASQSGRDGQKSSGDWTSIGFETEVTARKRRHGKPKTTNDTGPETGRRKSGF